jgi:hypothetical protein
MGVRLRRKQLHENERTYTVPVGTWRRLSSCGFTAGVDVVVDVAVADDGATVASPSVDWLLSCDNDSDSDSDGAFVPLVWIVAAAAVCFCSFCDSVRMGSFWTRWTSCSSIATASGTAWETQANATWPLREMVSLNLYVSTTRTALPSSSSSSSSSIATSTDFRVANVSYRDRHK